VQAFCSVVRSLQGMLSVYVRLHNVMSLIFLQLLNSYDKYSDLRCCQLVMDHQCLQGNLHRKLACQTLLLSCVTWATVQRYLSSTASRYMLCCTHHVDTLSCSLSQNVQEVFAVRRYTLLELLMCPKQVQKKYGTSFKLCSRRQCLLSWMHSGHSSSDAAQRTTTTTT